MGESSVPKRIPTGEGAVMRFFRFSRGLSEEAFAALAGVDVSTVRRWETTRSSISRDRLVELLDKLLDVPPEAVEEALSAYRRATVSQETEGPFAPSKPERRLLGRAAVAAGRAGAETARRGLALDRMRQLAARHTVWAREKWSRLKKLPPNRQDKILRGLRGNERSWALALRLCEASEAAAADSAAESLRLARHGVALARATPGTKRWRLRLLGACEPYLANALRVGGDLTAAREAFASADALWAQGEDGDPASLLDITRRLDLKASFLQCDGRAAEALFLLEQALQGARSDQVRARLLVKKAFSLAIAGDYEASIEALQQAELLIGARSELRLLFACPFNVSVNFCHMDRFQAAEALLPRVEVLAQELHTELDKTRTLWLRGRIRAGLGHKEEARAALTQVRQAFYKEKIAYDYALVSLELATIHLEEGRTRMVKELAEELQWIFGSQQVHQEALAALGLFQQAARMEEARADWTRRLVKYLYRAQHNPKLRFES